MTTTKIQDEIVGETERTSTQQRILREIEANRSALQALFSAGCGTGAALNHARIFAIQEDNLRLKREWDAELARIEGEKT